MSGSRIFFSPIDYNRTDVKEVRTPPFLLNGPAMTASSEDPAYLIGNTQNWNSYEYWRSQSVGGTQDVKIIGNPGANNTGDPASHFGGYYNAVAIWMPYFSDWRGGRNSTNCTRIELLTSTDDITYNLQSDFVNPNSNPDIASLYAVGSSRIILLKTDALERISVTPYIKIRYTIGAAIVIGATHFALLRMMDMSQELGTPIQDNIGYSFQSRDFINKTFNGGQIRGQRPYQRRVSMSARWMQYAFGIDPLARSMYTNPEPYVLAMDYSNNLDAAGQHLHTFPIDKSGDADFVLKTQFSYNPFMAATSKQGWTEWQ